MKKKDLNYVFNLTSYQFDYGKAFVQEVVPYESMCPEFDCASEDECEDTIIYYIVDFSKGTNKELTKDDEQMLRQLSKESYDKYLKLFIWRILTSLGCVKHRTNKEF